MLTFCDVLHEKKNKYMYVYSVSKQTLNYAQYRLEIVRIENNNNTLQYLPHLSSLVDLHTIAFPPLIDR